MVLLGVQEVSVQGSKGNRKAILFFDSGSTLTLCRHDWARSFGLMGRTLVIYMRFLTQEFEAVETLEYKVTLI